MFTKAGNTAYSRPVFRNKNGRSLSSPIFLNKIWQQRARGMTSHRPTSSAHTTPHLWGLSLWVNHGGLSMTSSTDTAEPAADRLGPPPPSTSAPLCPTSARSLKPPGFSFHPGRCPVEISFPAVESKSLSLGLPTPSYHLVAPLPLPLAASMSPSDNPRQGPPTDVTSLGGQRMSRSPDPQLLP